MSQQSQSNLKPKSQYEMDMRNILDHKDPTILLQILQGDFDRFPTSMRNHYDRMVVSAFIERVLRVCFHNTTDHPVITQVTDKTEWEQTPSHHKYIELFIQTHILRELYSGGGGGGGERDGGEDNPPSFIVLNSETSEVVSEHPQLREAIVSLLLVDALTSIKHVLCNTFKTERNIFTRESLTDL